MASLAAASSSKDERNSAAMEVDDVSAVNRFDDFAAVSVRKLNKEKLERAKALFVAKEAERVVVDGEMECIENVQVVLISHGATPEDITRLQDKFSVESKGLYLAVDDGVLFIYKATDFEHGGGLSNLNMQVGNHIDPLAYRRGLACVNNAGHAGALNGIQPDLQIVSRHGFLPETVEHRTRYGSGRVIFEVEDGNRNASEIRSHGHRLFVTGGNYLRIYITIKVYPERIDGTRAVLAVMYGRNAASHDAVEFRTAMSIGTADVTPDMLVPWGVAVPEALPPIGPVDAALHPLPAILTIPAAEIWYNIHDAAGAVVDMPDGFADLDLDLRRVMEDMAIPLP